MLKMKRALVPSAIIVFGALALACGGDGDSGDKPSTPGAMGGGDGGMPGAPACETGKTIQYRSTVVDATTISTTLAGIKVEVIDDLTGLAVSPPITAMSANDGKIVLPVPSCVKFGIKAWGGAAHTDTYSYHVTPENTGKSDQYVRMGGDATGVSVPALANYKPDQSAAAAAGAVYWKTPSDDGYDVVGCVDVEDEGKDIAAQDLRYFAESLPSSLEQWPLSKGTRKGDGRFFIGNMTASPTGTKHTLVAKLRGTEIGRADIIAFPRSASSTKLPNGEGANLYLAGIYIDAPAGAKNPTPADCQK